MLPSYFQAPAKSTAKVGDGPYDRLSDRGSPAGFSLFQAHEPQPPASPTPPSMMATPFRTVPMSNRPPPYHLLMTPDSTRVDHAFMDMAAYFSPKQTNLYAMFVDDARGTSPLKPLLPPAAHQPPKSSRKAPATRDSHDSDAADDSSADEFSSAKAQKGLKLLSVSVRDIVTERQSTTYKEVAEAILKDLNAGGRPLTFRKSDQAREEQNIKRRVYDALNVLISAGILVKEGKRVRKNDATPKNKVSQKRCEMNSLNARLVS